MATARRDSQRRVMRHWTVWCLGLAAPAAFALSVHAHGSSIRSSVRSPSSVQCYEQWPDNSRPEALAEAKQAELPQGEPPRAELPGAKYLSGILLNPKVDVALGAPVVASASIFAVQTLALGGNIGDVYFSPLEVFRFLQNIENSISVVFLVEYLLRWYASSLAPSYLIKPSAIIDLISFLPLVIVLMMGSQGSAVPDLAFLRLLRVLRLQRYLQDGESFNRFQLAVGIEQTEVRPYQLELARVGSSLLTLIFIATGSIYEAEHGVNENIPDFFTALYFGLTTLTTVGFGDIYPMTAEGRAVVCASIVVGVAVVPPQLLSLAEAFSEGLGQRKAALKGNAEVEQKESEFERNAEAINARRRNANLFLAIDRDDSGAVDKDELRLAIEGLTSSKGALSQQQQRRQQQPSQLQPSQRQASGDGGASELPSRPNAMAACSNCGQAVHISTAAFCHQCGTRLT